MPLDFLQGIVDEWRTLRVPPGTFGTVVTATTRLLPFPSTEQLWQRFSGAARKPNLRVDRAGALILLQCAGERPFHSEADFLAV